jgi:hypothetical protein
MLKNKLLKKSITRSLQFLCIDGKKTFVRSLMEEKGGRERISLSYIIICTGTTVVEKRKRQRERERERKWQ